MISQDYVNIMSTPMPDNVYPSARLALLVLIAAGFYSLYIWLLPKPIPGIPHNPYVTKRLLGDITDMVRTVTATKEVMRWLADQSQQLDALVCQVFVQPFSKSWVLLADYREARDMLLRRGKDFDRSTFTGELMAPAGHFHIRYKTGPDAVLALSNVLAGAPEAVCGEVHASINKFKGIVIYTMLVAGFPSAHPKTEWKSALDEMGPQMI
ncbi:Cytochrome P470 monooxygenase [Paramyrothecium foliicola]|nr:Cytochrome P470 monooxygenase [Paramyrothecium foliicola]